MDDRTRRFTARRMPNAFTLGVHFWLDRFGHVHPILQPAYLSCGISVGPFELIWEWPNPRIAAKDLAVRRAVLGEPSR